MGDQLVRLSRTIDAFNIGIGRATSWLYPVLMLVIVYNVAMRYGFSEGSIMLEEIQWHLYAAAFLCGLAYTLAEDGHVRVDVIYGRLTERKRLWIDLFGTLFLLIPFAAFLSVDAWPYFTESLAYNERSPVPSGLPARYVIKFFMFFGFLLLLLQGVSIAIQKVQALRRGGTG